MVLTMDVRRLVGVLATTVVLFGGASTARAQGSAVRLTLEDAIARGLDASQRIVEAQARRDASKATAEAAEAADRPQVTAVAGYTRTNHVPELGIPQPGGALRVIFPDLPDNYRARLDVAWPVFTAGRTQALARAAGIDARAAADEVETVRGDLRFEITRAYWALATATETVRVVEEGLRRVEAHLADARSRLTVGLVPPSDVLAVEARRARQEGLLIEARTAQRKASAELARLVGLSPETPIELDVVLTPAALPSASVAMLVDAAKAARPERRALMARKDAAAARLEAVRGSERPQLSVSGGVDYANPNPRILPRERGWKSSWDAGVTVAWSVWDGGRLRAQAAEAAAAVRAAQARLGEFDARLEVDVRQRWLDLESSLAAVSAAEAGVRAAAEARRVVRERYRQGLATNTEVLDAQAALLDAELDRTRALAATRLAEAALRRALGQ